MSLTSMIGKLCDWEFFYVNTRESPVICKGKWPSCPASYLPLAMNSYRSPVPLVF